MSRIDKLHLISDLIDEIFDTLKYIPLALALLLCYSVLTIGAALTIAWMVS